MELVSVHVPKTAGSAFRNVLRRIYGPAGLFEDYSDWPLDPSSAFNADPARWRRQCAALLPQLGQRYRAVHGHFAVFKYAGWFAEARRIIWLREPISWLVSLYFFWKNLPRSANSFQQQMLDEDLSLAQFAELPEAQNRITRTFLKGATLDAFDFVGLQEHFNEDLEEFGRRMSWPDVRTAIVNRNPEPLYQQHLRQLRSDRSLLAYLSRLNQEDIALYDQAQRLRSQRRAGRC